MSVLEPACPGTPSAPPSVAPSRSARFGAFVRGDRWQQQLARFTIVGVLSNIGYFLLFLLCYREGSEVANVVGALVSTAIANELHRRLTFRAADRVGWLAAQLEGGGIAVAGLIATSTVLAVLNHTVRSPGSAAEAGTVIVVTGLVGAVRFVLLRRWVY
ncbi:GtrA family protein [Nocardia stercoris]|uniref:GtrA family protein n=1 Tax=Nocardia stercoris TaxID=2483361 RepID=A0A3M2LDB1_9NOCA|nr:GtrA family protein [Nocardia stercoris]RMI35527.1 GtrA family protein [Nocardia stercoris]